MKAQSMDEQTRMCHLSNAILRECIQFSASNNKIAIKSKIIKRHYHTHTLRLVCLQVNANNVIQYSAC